MHSTAGRSLTRCDLVLRHKIVRGRQYSRKVRRVSITAVLSGPKSRHPSRRAATAWSWRAVFYVRARCPLPSGRGVGWIAVPADMRRLRFAGLGGASTRRCGIWAGANRECSVTPEASPHGPGRSRGVDQDRPTLGSAVSLDPGMRLRLRDEGSEPDQLGPLNARFTRCLTGRAMIGLAWRRPGRSEWTCNCPLAPRSAR